VSPPLAAAVHKKIFLDEATLAGRERTVAAKACHFMVID